MEKLIICEPWVLILVKGVRETYLGIFKKMESVIEIYDPIVRPILAVVMASFW